MRTSRDSNLAAKPYILRRAEQGAVGVREMLEMTPCDVFAYIRGRTIWLVGDSMMQVCPRTAAAGSVLWQAYTMPRASQSRGCLLAHKCNMAWASHEFSLLYNSA